LTPQNGPLELPPKKKNKKKAAKGLLSFGDDGEDFTSGASTPAPTTPQDLEEESPDASSSKAEKLALPRRLTPNPNTVLPAPKVMTKAALQAEAVARDNLRREFLALQEAVKATEILIPFVFYDGTNIPGGTVKVKKGDHVWLFLDRCRKVGAELGVAGGGAGGNSNSGKSKNDSRREWARVGVDDLMLVRGELIIPHVSISPTHRPTLLANSPILALRVLLLHCQSCTQHL
jgi:protein FAM50